MNISHHALALERLPQLHLHPYLSASLALVLVACITGYRKRKHSELPLPPGPKGLPLIGNLLDIPKKNEWVKHEDWKEQYGDVVHLKVLGQDMIYLNSQTAAWDLLEKRSSIYSDRPPLRLFMDPVLMNMHWNVAFFPYDHRWRKHRKLLHQNYNINESKAYREKVEKHALVLLKRLRDFPKSYNKHAEHYLGSIIMDISYGIELSPDDPILNDADIVLTALREAFVGMGNFVDQFPILKYMPAWFPGAGFKRIALAASKPCLNMAEVPFERVKEQMRNGQFSPSLVATRLEEASVIGDEEARNQIEEEITNVAAMALAAGFETTSATLSFLLLALTLYPEVQKKAQAELDLVVGRERLADSSDEESLPYTRAVVKEVLRWRPAVPFGLPHRVTEDDVYNGMRIPKGSWVFGNSWSILHDKAKFGPNTDNFDPERFLGPERRDSLAVFGHGRRICPGQHLARNALFIACCRIMQIFDIGKAIDDSGREVPVKNGVTPGMLVHPEPFECTFTLRPGTEKLLAD